MLTRTVTITVPLDLRATLSPLQTGRRDPTMRVHSDGFGRAWHTPEGPVTVLARRERESLHVEAHGPGARWALDMLPHLLGLDDDPGALIGHHPAIGRIQRRYPGIRMGRSGQVADVLAPTILAQKVPGADAHRAWLRLVARRGHPAPGSDQLRLPPTPDELATLPYAAFTPLGVERVRATTLIEACRRIARLEEALAMEPDAADARLRAIRGIGPWTSALVRRLAGGDADAVEVGDFHVKHIVAWNLAGEPRGTDERLLELLEPYRGQRGRVVRLLKTGGSTPPRYGPRLATRDIGRH